MYFTLYCTTRKFLITYLVYVLFFLFTYAGLMWCMTEADMSEESDDEHADDHVLETDQIRISVSSELESESSLQSVTLDLLRDVDKHER